MADKDWDDMSWNEQVSKRVNNHHDRLAEIEKKLAKILGDDPDKLNTVDNLLGNREKQSGEQ